MEHDRYGSNKALFVFGMCCLLLSVILIVFGFYISPYVMFGLQYDVPEFVIFWQTKLSNTSQYPQFATGLFMVAFFIIPGLLLGLIAHKISNHIDQSLLIEKKKEEDNSAMLASNNTVKVLSLTTKIIILAALLLIALFTVEWLISVPAPV